LSGILFADYGDRDVISFGNDCCVPYGFRPGNIDMDRVSEALGDFRFFKFILSLVGGEGGGRDVAKTEFLYLSRQERIYAEGSYNQIRIEPLEALSLSEIDTCRIILFPRDPDVPYRMRYDLCSFILSPVQKKIIKADDSGKGRVTGAVSSEDSGNGVGPVFLAREEKIFAVDMEGVSIDSVDNPLFRKIYAFLFQFLVQTFCDDSGTEVASFRASLQEVFPIKDGGGDSYSHPFCPFLRKMSKKRAGRTSPYYCDFRAVFEV